LGLIEAQVKIIGLMTRGCAAFRRTMNNDTSVVKNHSREASRVLLEMTLLTIKED
jgi:hypothetical protein